MAASTFFIARRRVRTGRLGGQVVDLLSLVHPDRTVYYVENGDIHSGSRHMGSGLQAGGQAGSHVRPLQRPRVLGPGT